MPSTITDTAPSAPADEPIIWKEDPDRQSWWNRILFPTPPQNPQTDEFQP
ncbi:hypothetical protein [Rhodococcus sp. 24CO]